MYDRIAFIKTAWSDEYKGEPVVGKYDYLLEGNEGHERFNFLPCGGQYYASVPAKRPRPVEKSGWLVIFVAKRNGTGPITVVGWYEDAIFEDGYLPRPEYQSDALFEHDSEGNTYGYCLRARKAHLIPVAHRTVTVSGRHLGSAAIIYAKGNGQTDAWRKEFVAIAEKVVAMAQLSEEKRPPNITFPDPEHRKAVEVAAIEAVKSQFDSKIYEFEDKQKMKIGYDLLFKNKSTKQELHVEVKGTSLDEMHFYMSRNEFNYRGNKCWRLAVVTKALTAPKVEIFDNAAAKKIFDFVPFAYEGVLKR